MSSPSLNELSLKTLENSTTGSREQSSIYENDCDSTIQSERMIGSLLSASIESVDEKMNNLAVASEDAITSTKQLQTVFHSFTSNTLSNYDQNLSTASSKVVETPKNHFSQLEADLSLSLAEEQDADTIFHAIKNVNSAKGPATNGGPIENLVLATLAFKEASFNQCDLLRAQTSAINRLATAIEDQNMMMCRLHKIACKTNDNNLLDKDNS